MTTESPWYDFIQFGINGWVHGTVSDVHYCFFLNVLGTEQGRAGTVRIRSRACKKTYDLEVQRVLMSCTCTCGIRSMHMVNGFIRWPKAAI